MDIKLLQGLGLTVNEAKIYLALLEIGQSLAGTIAKKAKVHRRNVYDALERLIEKGLVTYVIKSNRKYYEAINPEKIINILKEKLNIASHALPELLKKYKASKSKQEVSILQGVEGIKTFCEDIYKENKNLVVIGSTGKAYTHLKYFMPSWIKKMNKLKIKIKALWNFDAINKKEFTKSLKMDSKTLPEKFSTPTQIFIYGDKSGIIVWSETPLCILIKNKEISNGFRKYFDFMWKFSKR